MLGIVGTLALGAALLAELAGRPKRWARPLSVAAGALVLASATFVAVEYDTDVPRFDVVFYLPALGVAASVVLCSCGPPAIGAGSPRCPPPSTPRSSSPSPAFSLSSNFPPPALALLVLPAVVVDVATRQRWHPALTAASYTLVLHASYVPVRNLLGAGVHFDTGDVLVGALLTFLATLVVFALAGSRGDGSRRCSTARCSLCSTPRSRSFAAPRTRCVTPPRPRHVPDLANKTG